MTWSDFKIIAVNLLAAVAALAVISYVLFR